MNSLQLTRMRAQFNRKIPNIFILKKNNTSNNIVIIKNKNSIVIITHNFTILIVMVKYRKKNRWNNNEIRTGFVTYNVVNRKQYRDRHN